MRRRLLVSNLALITTVLLLLELPLALVYSRHEHDALDTALERDASSLAALSEELIENPDSHDVDGLAQRFASGVGGEVIILDRNGRQLTSSPPVATGARFDAALQAARAGREVTGETGGAAYAAIPVGANSGRHGAVLIARSDSAVDRRVRLFWLALAGIGAGVLVISVFVSRRLARWAVDPLRRLDENAAALGRGDLHTRARTHDGPPEVIALASTFNEMADRLDALVTSQRRFVADASHQLRTPLTALRLRLENLDTSDPVAVATARDAALLEGSRLTRIVDGLLALARAEGYRPERQPVDVVDVITQRHEAWAPLAAEHDIDLRLATNGGRLTAMIVPGHLDQILDNLIDNALDATPPGGFVELRAEQSATSVQIHVIDQGRGMSDEDRRRAFDPFWQSPDRHATGNTGLGLAIVEQLARSSNGVVSLERAPAGGVDAVVRFSIGSGQAPIESSVSTDGAK